MSAPRLERYGSHGVTLLGDTARPGGVTFAFTERTGGVSQGQWASLNLGGSCGDDPAAVRENRRRALAALGFGGGIERLVVPRQVHGDRIVTIAGASAGALAAARAEAEAGADAVVCRAAGVAVLLCFADCVPVVLAAPGGFAVVHSGWRGTIARIAAKALAALCDATGCEPKEVRAYLGPHIAGEDYEVSEDLLARFEREFGAMARHAERRLDLAACVRAALVDAGADARLVVDAGISTPRATGRFFSYRAGRGACGRHGAIAYMSGKAGEAA